MATKWSGMRNSVSWTKNRVGRFVMVGLTVTCLPLVALSYQGRGGGESDDRAEMVKQHQEAATEHNSWLGEISTMRVEHRSALATLARLEAAILEHDAELEEHAEAIRSHHHHMDEHSREIAAHEEHGDASDHQRLSAEHAEMEKVHLATRAAYAKFKDGHSQLMEDLAKLREHLEHHQH